MIPFELRQLAAIEEDLDKEYEERNGPVVIPSTDASSPEVSSSRRT